MRASFEYTIEREDESTDVTVVYYAYDDGCIDIIEITADGHDFAFPTTADEDAAILQACHDRVDEDRYDAEASYGDYLYDMRREDAYPY